ncbi:MAG: alkylhydroperoxidase [Pseudomonas sp.]|nr:alkylhydroperoxidase [Pseudomonas sp.]
MPRIPALTLEQAPAASVPLLENVKKSIGMLPNVFTTLAHSPAALGSYLQASQAFGKASLNKVELESIALATSQLNECEYCLAAHTLFGGKAGMSAEAIRSARDGQLNAYTVLARQIVETHGRVSDEHLAAARAAGLTDAKIIEVVMQVALLTITNYVNNVAATDVDFPVVEL